MYGNLWRCLRCNEETAHAKIIRGRIGKWLAATTCEGCGAMNYHNKGANWIEAAEAWRAVGFNADPRRLAGHYDRMREAFESPTPLVDKLLSKINEPGGNPARKEGGATHDSDERTLSLSFTLNQSDLQTNSNQDAQRRGATMNVHEAFPSKYLKANDLTGRKTALIIDNVEFEKVDKNKEELPVVYFKKQKKGLVLNKTNALAIEEALGLTDTDEWPGHKITLYPTKVDFQGKRVAAIRVEIPEMNGQEPPDENDINDEENVFA